VHTWYSRINPGSASASASVQSKLKKSSCNIIIKTQEIFLQYYHPVEPYLKQELVHAKVCLQVSTDSLESGWKISLWKVRWAKVWMRVCVCALVCVTSVLRMCCVYHLRFLLDVTAVAVGAAAA
jgi:hypothetical protein